ncbi:MAG: indolepyruvate oxidoreductase subunit beta [Abditibacteriota bacterium]|nr:indolepyruvate oxidoreductase subunit beta [Abditibacteriota bacterium]
MKSVNISLVGVGGQGTLLASEILCRTALLAGMDVKKNEVHGMAQRGGSVMSQVRIADKVYSPLVPTGGTDVLISFEKVEALRYAHLVSEDGICYVNDQEIRPITVSTGQQEWPEAIDEKINSAFGRVKIIPALKLAGELGNVKVANLIMLGALSVNTDIPEEIWLEAIKALVKPKFVEINLKAFALGRELG